MKPKDWNSFVDAVCVALRSAHYTPKPAEVGEPQAGTVELVVAGVRFTGRYWLWGTEDTATPKKVFRNPASLVLSPPGGLAAVTLTQTDIVTAVRDGLTSQEYAARRKARREAEQRNAEWLESVFGGVQ